MTDLAIVICTFHREELLEQGLRALARQVMPDGLSVRVIVVDNSDEGSADGVVAALARDFPLPLERIAAHPANISVARNAGVAAAAECTHLAFLDDDQEVEPGWLLAVAAAIGQFPHDALFGAVEPLFAAPDKATPFVRQLFSRQLDAPAGTELVAMGPAKTKGLALATNNSVFRRAAMLVGPEVFDPVFGHGGGEDYDLLCRMQRRGSRFAWLPGARVREVVPEHRCEPAYLRGRFYAGGQAFAAAVSNASARPRVTRWWLRLKALAQAGLMALSLPLRLWRGGAAYADYTYALAGVLGKLSFSPIYPIYRKAETPAQQQG